jgi:cold shock CspA family protein
VKEDDGNDIFVHQDDIEIANIDINTLTTNKQNKIAFSVLEYVGKY